MLWGSICLMLVLKHLEQVLNYRTIASAIHKPKHPIFSMPDLGIEKFMELGRYGIWKSSSSQHAPTFVDGPNLECRSRRCSGQQVS